VPDFIAIKRLGGTDLGWFRSLYHIFSNSNLKGINLNADVLIDEFYRDLAIIAAATKNRLPVTVTMFGPAAAAAYPGTYKLVKSPGSKNWRLNGTLVGDPVDEDHRFDLLKPKDIAVIAFDGRPAPTEITLILLAAADAGDAPLHAALAPYFGGIRDTMMSVDVAAIQRAVDMPGVQPSHPLRLLLADDEMEAALEDALQGGIRGIRRLRRVRAARSVTRSDVERANQEMSRVGAEGEALANGYLTTLQQAGSIREYDWASQTDSYSPYDFRYTTKDGAVFLIDVKSTKRRFDEDFHISIGEILSATESEAPYLIYRVHSLTDEGCKLHISEDIREFARDLLARHDSNMPGQVTADSFSIPVDTPNIRWGEEITLTTFETEEEI
jgi:hypothetical protein